jgi:putative hydrolase of the HAD superfamily
MRFASPIGELYHQPAVRLPLSNPPSPQELDVSFRASFKEAMRKFPCYGFSSNITERQWWFRVVRESLRKTGREYPDHLTDQYCRLVYQAFGAQSSFTIFDDTIPALKLLRSHGLYIGVLTNSPHRTLEDTLPLLGLDHHLDWFVSCSDIGHEKPDKKLFDYTYELLCKKIPSLKREEIIHIGDNYEADYLGARNAGFRSLLLG